jgi:uncharacterized protein YecT (DUF1311 family)
MRLVPLILGALLVAPAAAASFNCGNAADRFEKTICGDPVLSRTDETIATRYRAAMAALSPAGKLLLRGNQRAFLAYARQGCSENGPLRLALPGRAVPSPATCLEAIFKDRDKELGTAVQKARGHVFLTLVTHRAKIVAEGNANQAPRVTEARTLVQIDAPRNAAEVRWNANMRDWLDSPHDNIAGSVDFEELSDPADAVISETLAGASTDTVSVLMESWAYEGGAHGNGESETQNWSLRLGREIRNTDLFRDVKDRVLARIVDQRYQSFNLGQHTGCTAPVIKDSKATITGAGLDFYFDPYELGGYVCGGMAAMRWSELKPFLRPEVFAELSMIETPRPIN